MVDCNVVRDKALCVRRACVWTGEECRYRMEDVIQPNKTKTLQEGPERVEDGGHGMICCVIPVVIVLVLVLLFCCYWYCCRNKVNGKKKDEEEGAKMKKLTGEGGDGNA